MHNVSVFVYNLFRTFSVFNVNNQTWNWRDFEIKSSQFQSVLSALLFMRTKSTTLCQISVDLFCLHSSPAPISLVMELWQTDQKAPWTLLQAKQDPSWWSEMQIHSLFMQMRSRTTEQDVKPDAMSDLTNSSLASFSLVPNFEVGCETHTLCVCASACVCVWLTASS